MTPETTKAAAQRARIEAEYARRESAMLAGLTIQELGEARRAGSMQEAMRDLARRRLTAHGQLGDAGEGTAALILVLSGLAPETSSAATARHMVEMMQRFEQLDEAAFLGKMDARSYAKLLPPGDGFGSAAYFEKSFGDVADAVKQMRADLTAVAGWARA